MTHPKIHFLKCLGSLEGNAIDLNLRRPGLLGGRIGCGYFAVGLNLRRAIKHLFSGE